jgi:CspA family cold shock protein
MSSGNGSTPELKTGVVKWFNELRGYGFITVGEGNEAYEVFVHYEVLPEAPEGKRRNLYEGEIVEFEEGKRPSGMYAVRVYRAIRE